MATDEEFDWRTSPIDQPFVWGTSDINLRVDYANVAYIGHGGPIQFYAATVAARSSGIASSRLTTAPYPYYQTGWFRSLFELEPLFPKLSDLNAPQDASVQVGGTVTLSCSAVRADTYQWFHNGVPDGRSSGSSLQISNASAADAGEYHVRAQNSAGVTFSRTAHVTVTAAVFAPVITSHPRSGTITAGESITLNVTATGTAPLSYQWLRNSVNIANATGATYITPALQLANSGERYSVRVSNAQGSATSQEAIISVVPAPPPAAADQFEPNESSLTATPIATGAVISALISTSADVDWFRLGLSGAGTLRIALISPAGNDYDIELYGPSGTFLARSYEGAGAFESIAFNVPGSGTYTLRVYGYPQGNGSHNSAAPYFLSTAFDSGQLPPPAYSLSTSATSGTVTKSPNLASYSDGSLVTVTAMPAAGYQFSGWSGAYSGGANPILITMDGNKTLAANFSLIPTGGGNGGTASVRVSIVPQAAADAGAQWKLVTESDWHNSGNIVAVPSFGTYDVEFKAIDGWTKPNNKQVTVSAGLPDIWINSDAYIQHPVVPFIENFRDVAYGNGGFVAVGDSHNVSTSPDSVNWTRRAASSDSYPYRIVFGNGTFVAVCNSQARIITSPDGVTWTNRWNANPSYQFDAITYGNGRFVALAGNRKFMTSTDAVAWTITDSGVPEDLIDVTYGNGQFVAVGDQAVVATSPDGMTWTRRSVGTGAGLYGVTYGNQRYVAVGWAGDIASSPDALTWTRRTSNTSDLLVGVRHGAGTFVAVGYNGALVTSQDGVNWTRRASGTANTLRGIAFGQDKFAAVGLSGTLLNLGNFFPPLIAVQPASHVVKDSLPITLSVQANGAGPFSYQWKLNGSPLPGETGANLSLASATFAQAGNYSVEVSTPGAFQLSQEAVITVVPAQRGTVQFSVGSRLIDEQGGSVSISVIRTVGIDGTVSVNYTTTPGTASTDADFVSTSGVLTLPDGIAEATLTIPIIDDALFEPNESFTIAISNPSPGLLLGMLDHATVTISDLSDSDSDGIPDDYELTHNLNPYDSGDASADPDGDGASNLEEFFAGTNPHDATSKLRVTSFEKVGSEVHIEFPTVLGKSYRVEVSNDLTSNSWTIIADNIIGTGGTIIFIEESLTGTAQRFYRVRVFSP